MSDECPRRVVQCPLGCGLEGEARRLDLHVNSYCPRRSDKGSSPIETAAPVAAATATPVTTVDDAPVATVAAAPVPSAHNAATAPAAAVLQRGDAAAPDIALALIRQGVAAQDREKVHDALTAADAAGVPIASNVRDMLNRWLGEGHKVPAASPPSEAAASNGVVAATAPVRVAAAFDSSDGGSGKLCESGNGTSDACAHGSTEGHKVPVASPPSETAASGAVVAVTAPVSVAAASDPCAGGSGKPCESGIGTSDASAHGATKDHNVPVATPPSETVASSIVVAASAPVSVAAASDPCVGGSGKLCESGISTSDASAHDPTKVDVPSFSEASSPLLKGSTSEMARKGGPAGAAQLPMSTAAQSTPPNCSNACLDLALPRSFLPPPFVAVPFGLPSSFQFPSEFYMGQPAEVQHGQLPVPAASLRPMIQSGPTAASTVPFGFDSASSTVKQSDVQTNIPAFPTIAWQPSLLPEHESARPVGLHPGGDASQPGQGGPCVAVALEETKSIGGITRPGDAIAAASAVGATVVAAAFGAHFPAVTGMTSSIAPVVGTVSAKASPGSVADSLAANAISPPATTAQAMDALAGTPVSPAARAAQAPEVQPSPSKVAAAVDAAVISKGPVLRRGGEDVIDMDEAMRALMQEAASLVGDTGGDCLLHVDGGLRSTTQREVNSDGPADEKTVAGDGGAVAASIASVAPSLLATDSTQGVDIDCSPSSRATSQPNAIGSVGTVADTECLQEETAVMDAPVTTSEFLANDGHFMERFKRMVAEEANAASDAVAKSGGDAVAPPRVNQPAPPRKKRKSLDGAAIASSGGLSGATPAATSPTTAVSTGKRHRSTVEDETKNALAPPKAVLPPSPSTDEAAPPLPEEPRPPPSPGGQGDEGSHEGVSQPREAWEYLKKDSWGIGNFFNFDSF
eukprot:TRINITY_DN15051_c0_g1_i2.p1 TRINITY_DN15051_c0_g1~~TRINITY_DN15051_c0_g1_i2.p1  ORF type:complete len:917 (+),score=208.03 TRINITY_DN15051_c0_g1_i2:530-3280(+)